MGPRLPSLGRRSAIAGLAGAPALSSRARAAPLRAALLLPGRRDDGGFMQSGFDGFQAGCRKAGAQGEVVDGVPPRTDALEAVLRRLASASPGVVAAHGGQCNDAARTVSAEFPQVPFVVVQGGVEGPNLTSYEVLQEESAFELIAGEIVDSRLAVPTAYDGPEFAG